jgi:hypothetical protein
LRGVARITLGLGGSFAVFMVHRPCNSTLFNAQTRGDAIWLHPKSRDGIVW